MEEILIKRNDNKEIVKFIFNDKEKYLKQLENCRKW